MYHNEAGFGSVNETYKEAKQQLNSITIEDTNTWLEQQEGRQTKPYNGFNIYVADEPFGRNANRFGRFHQKRF